MLSFTHCKPSHHLTVLGRSTNSDRFHGEIDGETTFLYALHLSILHPSSLRVYNIIYQANTAQHNRHVLRGEPANVLESYAEVFDACSVEDWGEGWWRWGASWEGRSCEGRVEGNEGEWVGESSQAEGIEVGEVWLLGLEPWMVGPWCIKAIAGL
jgi:hypothetical protein